MVMMQISDDPPAGEWKWLESMRHLQETSFGVDYSKLHGDALADYLTENAFALSDELHEMMAETTWKTWARNRGTVNREAFANEAVDLLHFVANLLNAAGVTDDELWDLYRAKQERNAARQAHGYDSRASKCPNCRRELDKPKAMVRMSTVKSVRGAEPLYLIRCAGCAQRLGIHLPGSEITWDDGVDIPNVTEASFTDDR
jgi:phosphoribosyl-ATP pyrophosphohydrolase